MSDFATDRQAPSGPAVSRRKAFATLGAVGLAGIWAPAAFARQADGTPEPADGGSTPEVAGEVNLESTMPDWRFAVVTIQDPYQGALTTPDSLPSGLRILAYQVILTNNSDQPMEFRITDVRLRDNQGVEYRAGEYIGTEPRLVSQNLPDGERTRGWVWFALPEGSEPSSLVFLAPSPTLRVRLEDQ
jgi:hypothetical protein